MPMCAFHLGIKDETSSSCKAFFVHQIISSSAAVGLLPYLTCELLYIVAGFLTFSDFYGLFRVCRQLMNFSTADRNAMMICSFSKYRLLKEFCINLGSCDIVWDGTNFLVSTFFQSRSTLTLYDAS